MRVSSCFRLWSPSRSTGLPSIGKRDFAAHLCLYQIVRTSTLSNTYEFGGQFVPRENSSPHGQPAPGSALSILHPWTLCSCHQSCFYRLLLIDGLLGHVNLGKKIGCCTCDLRKDWLFLDMCAVEILVWRHLNFKTCLAHLAFLSSPDPFF